MFRFILIFIFTGLVSSSDEWKYPQDKGSSWGELCSNGTSQSPIDLDSRKAQITYFTDLKFTNYDQTLQNSLIVNNGHTVSISQLQNPMTMSEGPLKGKFVFEQMHFHWHSEHTIDGTSYPLEMHLVHRNVKYDSIGKAVGQKNGIAVVAVLFRFSDSCGNSAIEKLSDIIFDIGKQPDNPVTILPKIYLKDLLPKQISAEYFWYHGSLTTPNCNEGVTWLVMHETVPIWKSQLNCFTSVEGHDGKKLTINYRKIQENNDRKIYYVKDSGASQVKWVSEMSILLFLVYMIYDSSFYL